MLDGWKCDKTIKSWSDKILMIVYLISFILLACLVFFIWKKHAAKDPPKKALNLSKTKTFFQEKWDKLFSHQESTKFFEELESILLAADVGVYFTEKIVQELKASFGLILPQRKELKLKLKEILLKELPEKKFLIQNNLPEVVLVVGVNGVGKTTTIAKLCNFFQSQGKKVMVGAADTYRAAATKQLQALVERTGAQGVFQNEGVDPASVAFDATQAAIHRKMDVCIIDTAGRLHTKSNLMEELKKIKRVITKAMPNAPQQILMILDGTIGQNSLNQAQQFHEYLNLTGLIVTKLDGSAKGGAVLSISSQLNVPILFIGVGEKLSDLQPFNAQNFIDSLLEGL